MHLLYTLFKEKEGTQMKIAIGCDPNAQSAKEELIEFIKSKNYGSVTDFGSEVNNPG